MRRNWAARAFSPALVRTHIDIYKDEGHPLGHRPKGYNLLARPSRPKWIISLNSDIYIQALPHLVTVTTVFGPITAAALQLAPYRKLKVLKTGPRVATRYITMSDCFNTDKKAIITLTLSRKKASQIFEKLFKSKIHT